MGGVHSAESTERRLGLGALPALQGEWAHPSHDHGGCGEGGRREGQQETTRVLLQYTNYSVYTHMGNYVMITHVMYMYMGNYVML